MHMMTPKGLGLFIMITGVTQLIIFLIAPGHFTYRHLGRAWTARWYNIFNFLVVMLLAPAASILLMKGYTRLFAITQVPMTSPALLTVLEIVGLFFYCLALVMATSGRLSLGQNFQLGGLEPSPEAEFVRKGIYRFIRHPMYGSILYLLFGLGFLTQSYIFFMGFLFMFVIIIRLIPLEENLLEAHFGPSYTEYRKRVKALIPYIV